MGAKCTVLAECKNVLQSLFITTCISIPPPQLVKQMIEGGTVTVTNNTFNTYDHASVDLVNLSLKVSECFKRFGLYDVVSVSAVTVERRAKKQINRSVRRSEKRLQPVELKCVCFFFPQPGKLTEAFKYFVQGMGYSEYLLFIFFIEKCAKKELNTSYISHLFHPLGLHTHTYKYKLGLCDHY